jgi:hypothetical protein
LPAPPRRRILAGNAAEAREDDVPLPQDIAGFQDGQDACGAAE